MITVCCSFKALMAFAKELNDADIDHSDDQATKAGWIQASLEKIKSTPFALEPKHLTH